MSTEELFLRRAVVFAAALVYWGGVLIQARRVRRSIRRSPNVTPRGAKERILWVGWFLVVVGWMSQPFLAGVDVSLPGLRMWPVLLHPAGLAVGAALVVTGQAMTLQCYASMGVIWRMGVDRSEVTTLVRCGPYRWVRHPIYLFQVVILMGVLLLLPTPMSLAMVLLHFLCVGFKIADEEAHLSTVHGTEYRDYAAQTGRLLPRVRRGVRPRR